MAGHECYHCKQWIEAGVEHDCWTTTEQALTKDLSEDLRDAWERVRETAADLGEQRIYASHNSIMFARKACYFFVRPKRTMLELCIFLGRTVKFAARSQGRRDVAHEGRASRQRGSPRSGRSAPDRVDRRSVRPARRRAGRLPEERDEEEEDDEGEAFSRARSAALAAANHETDGHAFRSDVGSSLQSELPLCKRQHLERSHDVVAREDRQAHAA